MYDLVVSLLVLFIRLSLSSSSLQLYLHEPKNNSIFAIESISNEYINVDLRYQIFGNDKRDVEVCFELLSSNSSYIDLTCLKYDVNARISLNKLIPDAYTINLYMKSLDHTKITSNFIIIPLDLPRISLPNNVFYIVGGDINIEYKLSDTSMPINNINICLKLLSDDDIVLLDYYCMSIIHTTFNLKNINTGRYKVVLSLKNSHNEYYEDSKITVIINAIKSVEFLPSYEWEKIEAHETVPHGLEIILPLNGNVKMGKIPNPWRLQLSLPNHCKQYFLRMDVYRNTLISDIIDAAEKNCMKNCLYIIADNQIVADNQTVESSNLFNLNKKIEINETCSK